MLLPTRPPRLEGASWECDCGARLCFARRRYRARDFLAAGAVAVVWTAAGFLTGFAAAYPRIYWFAGITLVVIALVLHGVGKHEVQFAEDTPAD
jgi:hypothetical protein